MWTSSQAITQTNKIRNKVKCGRNRSDPRVGGVGGGGGLVNAIGDVDTVANLTNHPQVNPTSRFGFNYYFLNF